MEKLQERCKRVGMTVSDFTALVDVPERTLQGWCKSRPELIHVLFSGIAAHNVLDRVEELRYEFNYDLAHGSESAAPPDTNINK